MNRIWNLIDCRHNKSAEMSHTDKHLLVRSCIAQIFALLALFIVLRPLCASAIDRQVYYDAGDGSGPHLLLTEGGTTPVKSTYYTATYPDGISFIEENYAHLGDAYSCLENRFGWDYEGPFVGNGGTGRSVLASLVFPLNTDIREAGLVGMPEVALHSVILFGNLGSNNHVAADPEMVGHEFAHLGILTTSKLEGSEEARAIQESYADIISLLCNDAEYADWQIGNFSFSPNVRDLANPNNSGWNADPPSHMNDFRRGGSRHHNSLIFSKAVYLWMMGGNFRGVDVKGVGVDSVAQLFFEAIRRLPNEATFKQAYEQLKTDVLIYVSNPEERTKIYNSLNAAFSAVGIVPLSPAILPWIDLAEKVNALSDDALELTLVVSSDGHPEQVELYFSTQSVAFGCDANWINNATKVTLDTSSWTGDSFKPTGEANWSHPSFSILIRSQNNY